MNREEAIEILQGARITSFRPNGTARVKEALNMAIEALSAEIKKKQIEVGAVADGIYGAETSGKRISNIMRKAEATSQNLSKPNNTCEVDLISRADAMMAVQDHFNADGFKGYDDGQKMMDRIKALPSAEAEPMTEEVREALMRLSMCAREDCVICKYKDKCNFDFQYEESTKNMNTILDSLMRSKCEVDAKSDLISREDAIEALCHNCAYYTDAQCKTDSGYWCESGAMIREALPSADRPTGEWIFNPTDAIDLMFTNPKCSECGFESADHGNFCPNCGADMRGEEEPGQWQTEDGKPSKAEYSVYCSKCGSWSEYRTKYCGNCGSLMKEENDDR